MKFTKNQKIRLCERGDLTSLLTARSAENNVTSCIILEVRGDLSINVEDKKSLRVDRQVGRK